MDPVILVVVVALAVEYHDCSCHTDRVRQKSLEPVKGSILVLASSPWNLLLGSLANGNSSWKLAVEICKFLEDMGHENTLRNSS